MRGEGKVIPPNCFTNLSICVILTVSSTGPLKHLRVDSSRLPREAAIALKGRKRKRRKYGGKRTKRKGRGRRWEGGR